MHFLKKEQDQFQIKYLHMTGLIKKQFKNLYYN
jgi:hypothetical protein